jgi:GntR family transcriptional regulator
MLSEFQLTMDELTSAYQRATEVHIKLTSNIEGIESRLKLLRNLRRIIKSGHQMPTDMVAQIAAFRELVAVPGLAKALEAHKALDKFMPKRLYLQVADDIVRRIDDGEFTYRLPSERTLAEEYQTAYMTVRRAMEELRKRGMIRTIQGRGTYVVPTRPAEEATDEP